MDPRTFSPALRVLRVCLHLLTAGLLALVATRALTGDAAPAAPVGGPGADAGAATVVAVAAVMAAVYAAGPLLPAVRDARAAAAVWLGVLCGVWLVLLAVSADGLWLAFPLYFLQLHLLGPRWGVPAVALTALAAIASYVRHDGALNPGVFIGPLLGAAVAVATVLGYQALYRESERRRALIEELMATRTELAAAERTAGTLAERERLAREIHDTLAQGLSSIQLLLRAAQRTLPPGSQSTPLVEQARLAAQANLSEARRFVRALAPPDLEQGSLAAALARLCAGVPGPPEGPEAQLSVSGTPGELPTPYEVALLRIAQSALGNTVRHAAAGRATLTLSFMDTAVALDVVDDGTGFDPGATRAGSGATALDPDSRTTDPDSRTTRPDSRTTRPDSRTTRPDSRTTRPDSGSTGPGDLEPWADDGGFGLTAMRARAASLGGTFAVESAPGRGTAVAVTLPLPAATQTASQGGARRGAA